MTKYIYLDHHSTTPPDPKVLKAMMPYLKGRFGNASSLTHAYGRDAEKAVERARKEAARLLRADPREIIFTSGATESNNLALKGVMKAYADKGRHLVTAVTEHKSILDVCKRLESEGTEVTYLGVDGKGRIGLDELEAAVRKDTVLISLMAANNEVGTIHPIQAVSRLARKKGALLHVDAAQAAGKIPIDVYQWGADLLSFSAHKMYGPKGAGALFIRKKGAQLKLIPQMDGGGHEMGFRSGTLNVPAVAGFGEACRLAQKRLLSDAKYVRSLRNELQMLLENGIPGLKVHGDTENRLDANLNVYIPGLEAKTLLQKLPRLALSSGSACTATSIEPSYVLKAMGVPEEERRRSIRIGLGRFNSRREIQKAAKMIIELSVL